MTRREIHDQLRDLAHHCQQGTFTAAETLQRLDDVHRWTRYLHADVFGLDVAYRLRICEKRKMSDAAAVLRTFHDRLLEEAQEREAKLLEAREALGAPVSRISVPTGKGYCGPFVVAALLGISREEADDLFNEHRGLPKHTPVKTTKTRETQAILERRGYAVQKLGLPYTRSWSNVIEEDTPVGRAIRTEVCLVRVGHHITVVQGGKVYHTWEPSGVPLAQSQLRRKRVTDVYVIRRQAK